jgi:hypothetical protein
MSKAQVAYDYQKLLYERQTRIRADRPKTLIGRLIDKGVAKYYPLPLMPIDDDYRIDKLDKQSKII